MPAITPLQNAFSSGEISPLLLGQVEEPGYQAGLASMRNFRADPRGPAVKREGSRFLGEYPAEDGRIEFMLGPFDQEFLLIYTDQRLNVLSPDSVELAANELENPFWADGDTGWTEDVDNGTVTFEERNLILEVDTPASSHASVTQPITLAADDDLYIGAIASQVDTAYKLIIEEDPGGTIVFEEEVTSPGAAYFRVPLLAGNYLYRLINETSDTTCTFAEAFAGLLEDGVDVVTPWTYDDLPLLHFVHAPGGDRVHILHPSYPPYELSMISDEGIFTFGPTAFVNTPSQWQDGDYPRTGTYHEGRFYLGGTKTWTQTVWASKSGIYYDFGLGAQASDGLIFTLADQGNLRWMISTKNLLVGTTQAEHIITSVDGVITPGDLQVEQQSAYGSTIIQPVQIGDQVFYVASDSERVRALQYELRHNNWLSRDVTFFSNHITRVGIRYIEWVQNPNNLFICVLNDGTMAVLSYERGEEIQGWFRYETDGQILDSTYGSFDGVFGIISLVRRTPGELYVEVNSERDDLAYADSWVRKTDPTEFTIMDGLDHLEGREVAVTTNDAVHPNKVVSGGQIELDWPTVDCLAGLPYTAYMRTLPLDKGSREGSGQPYMKRYHGLLVTILESYLPKINGVRPPTRHPATPMNQQEAPRTVRAGGVQLGWDTEAIVEIEQDLPLPCTVVSIAGELAQEKL